MEFLLQVCECEYVVFLEGCCEFFGCEVIDLMVIVGDEVEDEVYFVEFDWEC